MKLLPYLQLHRLETSELKSLQKALKFQYPDQDHILRATYLEF